MRKSKSLLRVLVLAIITTFSASAIAQTTEHVFHINTSYMTPGMSDAAIEERNAMMKEYHEKVDMKNEFVLHQWNMVHYYSEDSREFVTVTEYASWTDIDKGNKRIEELEKLAWPDAKKREEVKRKMQSYFTSHKDAIYHGLPLMK
jgi:hypothetical protein